MSKTDPFLDTPIAVLAAGAYPKHPVALQILRDCATLVCCDGGANRLPDDRLPSYVVGDLDSIKPEIIQALPEDRVISLPSQDATDLEKCLLWLLEKQTTAISLLGATGLHEDHALANLHLVLVTEAPRITVYTDYGTFIRVAGTTECKSFRGQRVSIIPQSVDVILKTEGLAYPIQNTTLTGLHKGISNSSLGNRFSLTVTNGAALVYQDYRPR